MIKRDGGPAFFMQERMGLGGKPFQTYKFRTMVQGAEKLGPPVTSGKDPRITVIGNLLRKTKLDELPQLINVALGQVSLVGPRPEVPRYVMEWPLEDKKVILSVKPGITDYGSLIYSNEQDILASSENPEEQYIEDILPHKIKLYRKYLEDQSLWLDFRIILGTIAKIAGLKVTYILPELKNEMPTRNFAA